MEMKVDLKTLEKQIQRVFKKLGYICTDLPSHLFIIKALNNAYKNLTGKDISIDY